MVWLMRAVREGGARLAIVYVAVVALGTTVGGVALVATINYGQPREARFPDRDCQLLQLSWRESFTGYHVGREPGGAIAPELARTRA